MLFICLYFDYLNLVVNQKSDFILLKFGDFRGMSNLEIFIISCIFTYDLQSKDNLKCKRREVDYSCEYSEANIYQRLINVE
jgi:hypothetical protein